MLNFDGICSKQAFQSEYKEDKSKKKKNQIKANIVIFESAKLILMFQP